MSGPVDRASYTGRASRGPSEHRAPSRAADARPAPALVRHADFVTWQPPEEEGDDEPILRDVHGAGPRRGGGFDDRREAEGAPEEEGVELVEIYVNVGRRDGARASDFQRVLEEQAGIARSAVQRIRVRERNAFVSVRREDLAKALAAFSGATISGRVATAEPARERGAEGGDLGGGGP